MKHLFQKALELKYEYIALSEHNPANKLSAQKQTDLIRKRNNKIDQVLHKYKNLAKLKIFKLLEVDILANGSLGVNHQALDYLDAFIVSIHSSFRQSTKITTKRILQGLKHPKAKILGHPTGRLLGQREGLKADWELIFQYCAENNKAVEINSIPKRLDLPDSLVRKAKAMGVRFVINTDAHKTESLENIKFGVSVARRGWLTKKDVLNTLSADQFANWLFNKN